MICSTITHARSLTFKTHQVVSRSLWGFLNKMYPHTIINVNQELTSRLMGKFKGERSGFCRVGTKNYVLPLAYREHAERYYSMEIREDDVWIVTYPRSGTTIMQEVVWLIMNEFNYDESGRVPLQFRVPFYEFGIIHHPELHKEIEALNDYAPDVIEELKFWRNQGYNWLPSEPSPRLIKTHFPYSLLPSTLVDKCKSIYVARHPKSVAVSYFHHNRLLKVHDYTGDFEQYWELFENDLLCYSPYFEHILEGWQRRNDPNVLFLRYEDIVYNPSDTFKTLSSFLNKPITDSQITALTEHLKIDNFRKNVPICSPIEMRGIVNDNREDFVRKGGRQNWSKEFDGELEKRADRWISSNLKKYGLEAVF